jgi:phosphoenolpyruvate carboxykinase (ATP)
MVNAALNGELDKVGTWTEPFFGLAIPKHVDGVPDDVLDPRKTWADPEAYDAQAQKLVAMFKQNFQAFAEGVSAEILAAGPK